MRPARLPRPTIPGSTTLTEWFDLLCRKVEEALNLTVTGNVVVNRMPGTGIHLHVPQIPIQVVKTTSTITARSGATPGTGTVAFQTFAGTAFVADSANTSITVYNYSSNATLTTSGKYGVAIKIWGYWWLVVVEC